MKLIDVKYLTTCTCVYLHLGVENPLMRDRVFVISNAQGEFLSLKKLPTLTLSQISMDGNKVTLSHPDDHSSSEISFEIPEAASVKQVT